MSQKKPIATFRGVDVYADECIGVGDGLYILPMPRCKPLLYDDGTGLPERTGYVLIKEVEDDKD